MIAFEGVSVEFGGARVLHDVHLRVRAGALCVLVGPSGSGKSTLLRLVNRLVEPTGGVVRVRGKDVAGEEPARLRRSIGYAMQSVGLFPHRTVAQNIGAVPRLLGWERARIQARAEELLALVRLDPGLAGRYPAELSGGQAQRVAIARAFLRNAPLLLLDEPTAHLDPATEREVLDSLRRLTAGRTTILASHSVAAHTFAGRRLDLRDGQVIAAARGAA